MDTAYGEGYEERQNLIGKLFVPRIINLGENGVRIGPGDYPDDGVAFMVTNGRPIEIPKQLVLPTDEQRRRAMGLAKDLLGGVFHELGIVGDPYESWRPGDVLRYPGTNAVQALAQCVAFKHRIMTQDGGSEESITVLSRPVVVASNRVSIQPYPSYRLGVAFHETDHAVRYLEDPVVMTARFQSGAWLDKDELNAKWAQTRFQTALEITGQYANISPDPKNL